MSAGFFDLLILIFMAVLAVKGFMHGIIKEIFGLLGIIGGVYLGSKFGESMGLYVNNFLMLTNKTAAYLVGFASIVVIVSLIANILSMIVATLVGFAGLGVLDNIFGFVVGIAKVFLVLSVIFYLISNLKFSKDFMSPSIQNSNFYPIFISAGEYIVGESINNIPLLLELNNKTIEQIKENM